MLDIQVKTFEGEDNVLRAINEQRKKIVLYGINNLIMQTMPGTDIEVSIDVPGTEPEIINHRREVI